MTFIPQQDSQFFRVINLATLQPEQRTRDELEALVYTYLEGPEFENASLDETVIGMPRQAAAALRRGTLEMRDTLVHNNLDVSHLAETALSDPAGNYQAILPGMDVLAEIDPNGTMVLPVGMLLANEGATPEQQALITMALNGTDQDPYGLVPLQAVQDSNIAREFSREVEQRLRARGENSSLVEPFDFSRAAAALAAGGRQPVPIQNGADNVVYPNFGGAAGASVDR